MRASVTDMINQADEAMSRLSENERRRAFADLEAKHGNISACVAECLVKLRQEPGMTATQQARLDVMLARLAN